MPKSLTPPVTFEVIHPITCETNGTLTWDNYYARVQSYGTGHSTVRGREELITHYCPNLGALSGIWGIVLKLPQNEPFPKIAQQLLFAAFPHEAKKELEKYTTPAALIAFAENNPDQLLKLWGYEIPNMGYDQKIYRARDTFSTQIEIDAWMNHGKLSDSWQKRRDNAIAKREKAKAAKAASDKSAAAPAAPAPSNGSSADMEGIPMPAGVRRRIAVVEDPVRVPDLAMPHNAQNIATTAAINVVFTANTPLTT